MGGEHQTRRTDLAREGLKVPQKQPKRGRLWLNDGSCIRLRPLYPNHIWSYDFVDATGAEGLAVGNFKLYGSHFRRGTAHPTLR